MEVAAKRRYFFSFYKLGLGFAEGEAELSCSDMLDAKG